MMMGWDMGWGWGGMALGSLSMILFWGGLLAVLFFAIRALSGGTSPGSQPHTPRPTPLEILQTRYAKGEIARDEFERMRNDLQHS